MATKTCPNGHQYDSGIYGDKCPFCPSSDSGSTVGIFNNDAPTRPVGGAAAQPISNGPTIGMPTSGTIGMDGFDEDGGGHTIVHHATPSGETGATGYGNNRLVGLLASYDIVRTGEVYKVYEGRTTIGRDRKNTIAITNDGNVSGTHLMILYVEAGGKFWAKDQMSTNGTYINGKLLTPDQAFELNSGDIIVMGHTKFVFLSVPQH